MSDRNRYKEVIFKGVTYDFEMLNVLESVKLSLKVKGALAGILRSIGHLDINVVKKIFSTTEKTDMAEMVGFAPIIADIIDAIPEAEFYLASEVMMKLTSIKTDSGTYRKINVIEDFNGKTFEYLVVTVFALRHNFADFFDGFLSN